MTRAEAGYTSMSQGSQAVADSAVVWSLLTQAEAKLSLKGLPTEADRPT